MLYLFDLDGTLVSSYMEAPGKAYTNWHLLPGRRERLQALLEEEHTLAIVTNQGGIAFGIVSLEQMRRKLATVLSKLGLPDDTPTFVATHDVRGKPPYNVPGEAKRRKPSGAMLREAMAAHPAAAAEGVLMVGDHYHDRDAARDAGVRFMWAKDFFGSED